MVILIQRLEGAAFFFTALFLYSTLSGDWILFALLLFAPDIAMIGYVKNKKLGALTYNLVHNYLLGLLIIMLGLVLKNDLIVQLGLILFAHVGLDRSLGYGLKYESGFKDTHLGKIGK